MKNKVAILARVSTVDQSTDRQVSELTSYAEAKGLEVVQIFTEVISGTKKNSERPTLQQIIKLAETKKINKILVHEVSRLGRSTFEVLGTLEALHALKVSVMVMNYQLDTLREDGTVNPMSQFLLTILADIARMERAQLVERVKSGLQEAKRKGTKLGRKEGYKKDLVSEHKRVVKYLKEGRSIRETATLCDVGVSTVQRVKKHMEELKLI